MATKSGARAAPSAAQFGLATPINGVLMAPHVFHGDATIDPGQYVDVAVEPEFVFRIGGPLSGHDLDDDTLRSGIAGVSPGIELHNYRFFHGAPSSQELIASNGIHAALVVGNAVTALDDVDIDLEGVGAWVNGELRDSGIGAEIMGGPLGSLRWLVGQLTDRGQALTAGDMVIPGSAVGLIRVEPGDSVEARFTHFGKVLASFSGQDPRRTTQEQAPGSSGPDEVAARIVEIVPGSAASPRKTRGSG